MKVSQLHLAYLTFMRSINPHNWLRQNKCRCSAACCDSDLQRLLRPVFLLLSPALLHLPLELHVMFIFKTISTLMQNGTYNYLIFKHYKKNKY